MDGWIKIHKQMIFWEWYDHINTKVVFFHLLLIANFEDKKWRGKIIKRGQVVTSITKLAEQTKLTPQNIRTVIKNLKSTGELTYQSTSEYSLFTLNNYDNYQSTNTLINNRSTTTKEVKKIRSNTTVEVEVEVPRKLNSEKFKKEWEEFKLYRIEKKQKMTPRSQQMMLNKLNLFSEEVAIKSLQESIINGWTGVFPDKYKTNQLSAVGQIDALDKLFNKKQ